MDNAIKEVKAAQQSGDFVRYGQALQKLETAMTNFQTAQAAAADRAAPRRRAVGERVGQPGADSERMTFPLVARPYGVGHQGAVLQVRVRVR